MESQWHILIFNDRTLSINAALLTISFKEILIKEACSEFALLMQFSRQYWFVSSDVL